MEPKTKMSRRTPGIGVVGDISNGPNLGGGHMYPAEHNNQGPDKIIAHAATSPAWSLGH